MNIDSRASRVIVETSPRGLLAAAAHDLRIDAPIAGGESADGTRCSARFEVAAMKVAASRRHGTPSWHEPNERDARDIERRIREEAFAGLREIVVDAALAEGNARAKITTRATRSQTLDVSVRVEHEGAATKVHGTCELSLEALGAGKIHVPLGAIKLDDRVVVTFDLVFA